MELIFRGEQTALLIAIQTGRKPSHLLKKAEEKRRIEKESFIVIVLLDLTGRPVIL